MLISQTNYLTSLNSVLDATDRYAASSNVDLLFSKLNAGILVSGDVNGVQSSIDGYTSSLQSSNVYMSSYTAPSAQFLHDLDMLKNAANEGDLAGVDSALAAAKLDAPENVTGGEADAVAKGDTVGMANLMLEARSNIAGGLVSQGYTPEDALAEANAIMINGFFVSDPKGDQQSSDTRLQNITSLAVYAAKVAAAQHGASGNSNDPMFNILESLLQAHSPVARNQTLSALVKLYMGENSGTASSGGD